MKSTMKITLLLAVLLLSVFASSCSTTGEYMPLANDEIIIGTVQTTFEVKSSFFFIKSVKNSINTEAYIKLLETGERKYPGSIDIRDIVWVTGKQDYTNPTITEIYATAKVIRVGAEE